MNLNRVHRWSKELNTRLESEVHGTRKEKFLWLAEHLGEYVQRWLGFACLDQFTVEATFDNDAFCIIVGALNVINEQLSGGKNEWVPVDEWEGFANAIDFIQEHPAKENLSIVAYTFNRFWESVPR